MSNCYLLLAWLPGEIDVQLGSGIHQIQDNAEVRFQSLVEYTVDKLRCTSR